MSIVFALMALFACSTAQFNIDAEARDNNLAVEEFSNDTFDLRIYSNSVASKHQVVYIEGDGRPWSTDGRQAATDPTPHHPLAFNLMTQTTASSHYVTRPCYFRLSGNGCRPETWTDARFSETIVASMTAALESTLSTELPLILIGYSGGGALALLIGSRIERDVFVVTIAGLVDTEAWTQSHGYQPLVGSLNPAAVPSVQKVRQLHLIANRDITVPPDQTRSAVADWPRANAISFAKYDHACCWEENWPKIWRIIETEVNRSVDSH